MILVRVVSGALDDDTEPFIALVRLAEDVATCVNCGGQIEAGTLAAFHDRRGLAHLRSECPLRAAAGMV